MTILPAIAILLSAAVPTVLGQSSSVALYGQCGGSGYSGSTTCVSGATCYAQNQWYSQCIPGTASTTLTTSTAGTTTAARTTTTTTTSSTSSSSSSSSASTPAATGGTKHIFSFGDSYSQTGFWAGGTQPTADNPLGNPTFPGSTTSGGTNWVGYLVTEFNPTVALSYNFASSGASVNNSIVSSWGTPLTTQVATFLQYYGAGAGAWSSDDSLFVFWIGINDIWNSYSLSVDQAALHTRLMDNIFGLAQQLHDVGARKFLFMNVPPVEKAPSQLGLSAAASALQVAQIADYNSKLVSRGAAFAASASGTSVWQFDTHVPFNQVLANPAAYGYNDATTVCQTSVCMWYDNYHPSEAMHEVVAEQLAESLAGDGFW